MLLSAVEYARPSSVAEAIRLLSKHDGARPLAGGQTLVNVMKTRMAAPDILVDLADLAELRAISRTADGGLEIGAMVTYADLMGSSEVAECRPILAEVASQIADVQVRNRGTVGGNVCANDPTNHLPPLMVALGASMTIAGADGSRTVPAEEFFVGVYMTAVRQGELLTRITIPPRGVAGDAFSAVTIGTDGTAIVSVAATVRANGAVEDARIAIGCVSAVPERARAMEEALRGMALDGVRAREAAKGLGASLDPPADAHGSAEYRRHLAEVLAVRAVMEAAERGARG
jgi:aerobic carbon-monoxide dehydrogenase medium subunit